MRVLMQIRDNYLTGPGGDTIQLLKTKEYLEKINVDVDISTELEPDLTGYDLVHLFNLTRIQETYLQAKNAKKQGKPIALSTIYWPFDEINEIGYTGYRKIIYSLISNDRIENLKALYKYIFRKERNKGCVKLIFGSYSKMQRWVVENSNICLPNAEGEMKKVNEVFKIRNLPYIVVPNAIDSISVAEADKSTSTKYEEYKDFIICVARISRRKNQLLLIEALKNTNYNVLFVGKSSPGEMDYYKMFCDQVSENANMHHIESIPNNELYLLYKQCRVSVLPSWFETPGLVSLEAAAMGCNIAITDKGTTRDYFGDKAFYFDLNKESILNKVQMAFDAPNNTELKQFVRTNYTWEKAAEQTLQAYKILIGE